MVRLRAEFTVEPFRDGNPGPHVIAGLAAVRRRGIEPDIGPFATALEGDANTVLEAIRDAGEAAFAAGAIRISVTLEAMSDGLATTETI